jgi:hypothetical protein
MISVDDKGTYPPHDIDPKLKDKAWGMKYAKAAWSDWNYTIPRTCFYNAADKYEELRLYAHGKQPINKYKKLMAVDEQTDNTWLVVDWSVRPIIPKFRDIAISRLVQQEYNIVATPIDPQAKGELDSYYADTKAKIALRKLMEQQNPEFANHPILQQQPGEPLDFEELEMRVEFGEQFNRSKDAEQAIQLMLYENDAKIMRRRWFESMFDCGPAGYKAWLDKDGRPRCRDVNPEAVVTNYCRFSDFRDLLHAGEVIDVSLIDLAVLRDDNGNTVFTPEQIDEMKNNVAGKWSNPAMVGRSTNYFKSYDKNTVKVLDIQFYSYNELNFERNVNRRGNLMFNEVEWERRNNKKDKFLRKKIKVVYEVKWIIGTDYAYDFRLKKDMKRSVNPEKMANTTLDYKFFAPNFYEMRTLSMMERLLPLADEYQMCVYRIQNFINRMVPNGWWVDLDALENVALNKGGENMKPVDLLQMFFETGILAGRSKDIMGNNVNYKPVIPIDNNAYDQLKALYEHLQITITQMQSIIGLNELTDGSTPNPKTLNGVASIAVESTNNSLFPLQFGERYLLESLANDMLMLMQQSMKKGKVEGYAKALSSNALQFIEVSDTLRMRDYGIMLDERPTDDQKQLLLMAIQQDQAQGFLDSADALYILNVYNVKQAQQMLAYKARKNKEASQKAEMSKIQETIQGQQQSAAAAEQMRQQTLQLEWGLKMQYMEREKQLDMAFLEREKQLEAMLQQADLQGKYSINTENNQTKIVTTQLQNDSKERIADKQAEETEPA